MTSRRTPHTLLTLKERDQFDSAIRTVQTWLVELEDRILDLHLPDRYTHDLDVLIDICCTVSQAAEDARRTIRQAATVPAKHVHQRATRRRLQASAELSPATARGIGKSNGSEPCLAP